MMPNILKKDKRERELWEKYGFAPLGAGPECKWAKVIRYSFMKRLEAQCQGQEDTQAYKALLAYLRKRTDSRWWVNNRRTKVRVIIDRALRDSEKEAS